MNTIWKGKKIGIVDFIELLGSQGKLYIENKGLALEVRFANYVVVVQSR